MDIHGIFPVKPNTDKPNSYKIEGPRPRIQRVLDSKVDNKVIHLKNMEKVEKKTFRVKHFTQVNY